MWVWALEMLFFNNLSMPMDEFVADMRCVGEHCGGPHGASSSEYVKHSQEIIDHQATKSRHLPEKSPITTYSSVPLMIQQSSHPHRTTERLPSLARACSIIFESQKQARMRSDRKDAEQAVRASTFTTSDLQQSTRRAGILQ